MWQGSVVLFRQATAGVEGEGVVRTSSQDTC